MGGRPRRLIACLFGYDVWEEDPQEHVVLSAPGRACSAFQADVITVGLAALCAKQRDLSFDARALLSGIKNKIAAAAVAVTATVTKIATVTNGSDEW